MRGPLFAVVALVGCGGGCGGGGPATPADAPETPDAAACPRTLLDGGAMVDPQGWTVITQGPASLTYGADHVRIETSTIGNTGGMMLLRHPGALPPPPFRFEVVLLVERVDAHNALDAAAAILAAFTPPFGAGAERAQMIYLDGAALGWADGAQALAATIADGAYHAIELAVDGAGAALVKLDGVPALVRAGFASDGAISVGDQTNDRGVDGAIRIRSVTVLCP
jgi:hypothetical protein